MDLLLDTNVLLWALMEPDRLGPATRDALENPANTVQFSAASIWEIAIKKALYRPSFQASPEQILQGAREAGFVERPVTSEVAARVAYLPPHHRDPFDRLLIAQALSGPSALYTADAQLTAYSELVFLV
ncbi:MAG TPA: type II toxin-antitoxin system VapC family toxin [Caulobacteraceae bacterium]|nr:type II toxin-antitoxin system VapC family toxin [Caulobacteraceae bacterium]